MQHTHTHTHTHTLTPLPSQALQLWGRQRVPKLGRPASPALPAPPNTPVCPPSAISRPAASFLEQERDGKVPKLRTCSAGCSPTRCQSTGGGERSDLVVQGPAGTSRWSQMYEECPVTWRKKWTYIHVRVRWHERTWEFPSIHRLYFNSLDTVSTQVTKQTRKMYWTLSLQ